MMDQEDRNDATLLFQPPAFRLSYRSYVRTWRMNAWLTWLKMLLVAIVFLAAGSTMLWAALGEGANSIVADQQEMGGEIKTIPNADYTINEITTRSGTLVREYVSPDGRVFAVSWRGPTAPDLASLLGSYFQQ